MAEEAWAAEAVTIAWAAEAWAAEAATAAEAWAATKAPEDAAEAVNCPWDS